MVTVGLLLSVVIIPIIIATAVFDLAVIGTQKLLVQAADSVAHKFHKNFEKEPTK